MYKTCMFCNQSLGTNTVVETFPVGRRLAFDSHKGRLWAVCRKCERWNLSPLDERWEAVEDCERLFEALKTRVSTEHIGLGRHPGGLDLVRVGPALRPEFAAWRYGDQFGRRRKKYFIYGAAALAVFGGVIIGGAATGIISGGLLGQSGNFVNLWMNGRTLGKVELESGEVIKLKQPDLQKLRLVEPAQAGQDWAVELRKGKRAEVFEGEEARRVAGLLLPSVNRSGAKKDDVQDAVRAIEAAGHPEALLAEVGRAAAVAPGGKEKAAWTPTHLGQTAGLFYKLPTPTRLALEMALHEEQERRALEGELAGLRAAWRSAEEIAEIADNLLLPEGTEAFLDENRPETKG